MTTTTTTPNNKNHERVVNDGSGGLTKNEFVDEIGSDGLVVHPMGEIGDSTTDRFAEDPDNVVDSKTWSTKNEFVDEIGSDGFVAVSYTHLTLPTILLV